MRVVPLMLCAASLTLSACATKQTSNWLSDGVLSVARSVPAAQYVSGTALGFIDPMIGSLHPTQAVLRISRERGIAELFRGDKIELSAPIEGTQSIKPGTYQIRLKQTSPLWYAPSSYFESRGLDVPLEGDRARYLRGALGEYVLFVDAETPIHAGPIWCEDIGGARLAEEHLSKIYYSVEEGTAVVVE